MPFGRHHGADVGHLEPGQLVVLDQQDERVDPELVMQPTCIRREVAVVLAREPIALLAGEEGHPEAAGRRGERGHSLQVHPVDTDRLGADVGRHQYRSSVMTAPTRLNSHKPIGSVMRITHRPQATVM